VQRGGTIVKVEVSDDTDELDRVTDAFDDAGAVDIEELANVARRGMDGRVRLGRAAVCHACERVTD